MSFSQQFLFVWFYYPRRVKLKFKLLLFFLKCKTTKLQPKIWFWQVDEDQSVGRLISFRKIIILAWKYFKLCTTKISNPTEALKRRQKLIVPRCFELLKLWVFDLLRQQELQLVFKIRTFEVSESSVTKRRWNLTCFQSFGPLKFKAILKCLIRCRTLS